MDILKGKPVADELTVKIIENVKKIQLKGIVPKLQLIRVGNRGDDLAYERGALKRMAKCGIETEVKELDAEITEENFIKELEKSNADKAVNGILVFRPLPKQISENKIKYIISAEKDVDCFSPINVAKIMEGDKSGFEPCTPKAVMEMLDFYDIDLKGKNVVVIGRSMVVGKPLSMLLMEKNATVTICHSKTKNLPEVASRADIVIAAIGRAKMIDDNYIGENSVVIDVGINVDENGKLCGDVDFDKCSGKCSMITPVPRGVGSVTTTVLAGNVLKACKINE